MSITVSKSEIGEEAFDVGNLIGLLNEGGDLQTDWFKNPATQLEAAPGRAKPLIQVIQSFLGPKAEINEQVFDGAEWYQIQNPSTGNATGFYAVTPPATDAGGLIGLGVEHGVTVGNLTINFYLFIPLFKIINGSNPDFVLINNPSKVSPIKVGLDMTSSVPLKPKSGGEFTNFIVEGQCALDGKLSDAFKLNIEFKNDKASVAKYSNLTDFIKASETEDRIGTLIVQGMAYWLNLFVGSSDNTVGDVMVDANLLAKGKEGELEYYEYDSDALKKISTNPLQAAEDLGFAILKALADNEAPLIPLPFLTPNSSEGEAAAETNNADEQGNGASSAEGEGSGESEGDDAPVAGIWIAFEGKDPKQGIDGEYGLRIMIPDIPIALGSGPKSPTLHLRLGQWFTGEDSDETGWVNTIIGGETPLKPGVSVFFLEHADNTVRFKPSFELTSVGFDLVGAKDTPLLDVKGVTLGAAEMRAYVNQNADWQFGFGCRVDDVGIPLGTSFTGGVSESGGNPVAKTLVSSGDNASGATGGDAAEGKTDAVNPTFSLEAAYVSGTVKDEHWFVELLPPNGAAGDIVWFPVNRKFGPLECQKLGLGWNQKNLMLDVVLDAGVSLSGLSAQLIELSLGIPLSDPTTPSSYELDLKGLDVSYTGGGVDITGGLLKSGSGDTVEYDGLAMIKVSDFGIGAIGSFASLPGGGTSMFIFAILDAPLGGPAAFFVTGLALGFGYNRKLVAPAMDKVSEFPLVKGMKDPAALGITPGQPPNLGSILGTMKESVPPSRGDYWLAAGVMFTSFELIKSTVLLAVEFGNQFEILILGTSVVKLPQEGSVTMAYAELEIEIVIAPDAGVFEATAILSPNSYVIDPSCKLTGGFAFFIWFGSNEHAGDFVLTIGGYHPAFKKPKWYPDIPRLGFNWKVSDTIEISGGAYFALTPSCIMAGGSLKALFHAGPIRAWFDAHADMLISWKPFFYDISIGVTIGVSVKVDLLFIHGTIKVEVGADLEIWGPPTGGKVRVHLWVVSFTIAFGPDRSAVKTLTDWDGFKTMLPPAGKSDSGDGEETLAKSRLQGALHAGTGSGDSGDPVVCSITYNTGVPSTITVDKDTVWVVNPSEFSFNVGTTAPVTEASLNGTDINLDIPGTYFVAARPMGVNEIQTPLTVTIKGDKDADWEFTVLKGDVPEAMWGRPLPPGSTPPASATLLTNRVTGLTSIQPEPHTPQGPPVIDMLTAFTDVPVTEYPEKLPLNQQAPQQGAVPAPSATTFENLTKIMDSPAKDERAALFAAFNLLGIFAGSDGSLSTMADDPYYAYRDEPMSGSPLAS